MPSDTNSDKQLKAFVERIEALDEDRRALVADIKDVYAEAKGSGYDAKVLRKVIAIRRRAAEEVEEENEVLRLYLDSLGIGHLAPVTEDDAV